MVDNSMEDETWNDKKTLIEGWMDSHPDWADEHIALLAVPQLIAAGDAKPDSRKSLYAAIRTCFGDISDKPFRAGRGSTMPASVTNARNGILTAYHADMVTLFEESEAVQTLENRHGKSGGGNYDSAEEFADDATKSRRLTLNAAYKAFTDKNDEASYSWDGESPVVLVCNIVVEDSE
tara:strand:+ start:1429 stop:1962 length:534 start_codon:yes stop_codon:yes gene_type:complete